ncbi:MAG TPA: hypothetical protein VFT13_12465 [Candidatus Krumholzibacteria bacterium]|nr:hypothetical protein [Candidatus Krumholzibacteria bacterium]
MRTTQGAPILLALVACLVLPGQAWAQEVISEVMVIRGSSSGIQPPAGYVKINADLNAGAGGDYIYVCYKKGIGAPITGLYVTLGSGGGTPAPDAKYTRIPVDLNDGAGGDYIWLWTTKDPDCAAVKDIIVQFEENSRPPGGYTWIGVDLNRNAGGQYIWLSFLKN